LIKADRFTAACLDLIGRDQGIIAQYFHIKGFGALANAGADAAKTDNTRVLPKSSVPSSSS